MLTLPQQQLEANFLFDRLVKDSKRKENDYRFMNKIKLIEIYIYLSRFYAQRQMRPIRVQANENEMIQRICEFIEIHHVQPSTLSQVGRISNMSQTAFTIKFRKLKGQTFPEYRNAIRILVAKRLLAEVDKKISEIAKQVGIEESNLSGVP